MNVLKISIFYKNPIGFTRSPQLSVLLEDNIYWEVITELEIHHSLAVFLGKLLKLLQLQFHGFIG